MKEQDAAHSFEKEEDDIRGYHEPDDRPQSMKDLAEKLKLEKQIELAELTRLRSELQQKDEYVKELCHVLEGITQIHFENGSRPSKRDIERIKSLIEKVKSNILK